MFILVAALPCLWPAAWAQTDAGKHSQHAGMQMSQPEQSASEHDMHFASGTAWQPASSPEPMWMRPLGDWTLMAHFNAFLTYNQQGGPRGVGKLESMNMLMLMEQRRLGRGTLLLRQMFSADALTAPHGGFPQLFQTGESYKGRPLIDRQHPHDAFGEVSALYSLPLNERLAWHVYAAPAGEPALGPVAYVHRDSAAELPFAPLSHHLQDSTHISYGVVSSGLVLNVPHAGAWKAEASLFNGREPDENRATWDFAPMDSWSARVAANPAPNWSAQYSYGHLVHPEALEPGDINRQTASLHYNRPLTRGNWSASLIWGRNRKLAEQTTQNSYLAESIVNFARKNYFTTRLELVDKDELFADQPGPHPSFRVGAYTFGGVRDVFRNEKLNVGIGAEFTTYSKAAALDARYGSNPVSFRVFLRIRPGGK